jgi:hypothetical protein
MRARCNAGWYGLMLVLCVGLVGACGGEESDEWRSGFEPRFVHPDLPPDVLLDLERPAFNPSMGPSLQPRVVGARRPWDHMVRCKAKRPTLDGTGLVDPDLERTGLVLCGENWVDTTSDPDHCGGCNQACATPYCDDSACVSALDGR